MSEKEIVKEYSNDDLTIVWKPKTCIHSEKCWRGLVSVFNPKARPWINAEGASSEEIKSQIDRCPSGALSYKTKTKNEMEKSSEASANIAIKVIAGGPCLISGEVTIVHKDGTEEIRRNAAMCRCGLSSNKPFCDGSHRESDFDA